MVPIGAHVSISGGYIEAFKRAYDMGGTALQMFTKSPRGGLLRKVTTAEAKEISTWEYRETIAYVVIHSSYLLNFAKPLTKSAFEVRSLVDDLESADKIGANGVVVHIGKKLDRDMEEAVDLFINNIAKILDTTKNLQAKIILENTAGQGTELGYRFDELGRIFHIIKKQTKSKDRIAICIDTAHLFAAGYDISTPAGVRRTLDTIDEHIGLSNIACIHFNDSKKILGSRVDRHEDIGRGNIGASGLTAFAYELLIRTSESIPFILETPESFSSFEDQIKTLRTCLNTPKLSKD